MSEAPRQPFATTRSRVRLVALGACVLVGGAQLAHAQLDSQWLDRALQLSADLAHPWQRTSGTAPAESVDLAVVEPWQAEGDGVDATVVPAETILPPAVLLPASGLDPAPAIVEGPAPPAHVGSTVTPGHETEITAVELLAEPWETERSDTALVEISSVEAPVLLVDPWLD